MRIAVYSPYLDTAGGGEKYMLTIAEALSNDNDVDVLLDPHLAAQNLDEIKKRVIDRHGLDLSKISFKSSPIGLNSSFLKRFFFLKNYDWFFYMTDGSVPFASAKNNIVHFQVPFENLIGGSLWAKIKLGTFKEAIFNSIFTKEIVEKGWPIKGRVVYPPVSIEQFKPRVKKNQIISVGRFFGFSKVKKHEVLIDEFKRLVDEGKKGWSLHLAGGALEGDMNYVQELKERAKGYEIFFYPNISLDKLSKVYGASKIYWHAMGFEETDPKKMEHFGITTVEAMAAGCVPVVIGLGGQREIIEEGVSGFLWTTLEELNSKTLNLMNDSGLMMKMSKQAQIRAGFFSKTIFIQNIKEIVYGKKFD